MQRQPTAPGINVNSLSSLLATIYLGVIGAAVFIVQPGFVQGLVEFYGFDEQQAGYIASAEVWGLALTTVILALGGHSASWQRILRGCIGLFVIGNLASLLTRDALAFGGLRFLTGLGAGGLVSLTFTIIGLTRLPDRNFGFLIMGVLTYGALGLWALPSALDLVGLQGVIVFFALFGASGWICLQHLPDSGEEHLQVEADAVDLSAPCRLLAIAAMFSYFFAQGVIWAYLFLIGTNAGVSDQQVANGLMLSQFLGIGGALVAALAGRRFGRIAPLALGVLGGAAVLGALLGPFGALVYTLTVCVYNFAWNMTHPFLLAAMASFDRHGKVVVHAVAAQMLGLAVGPAFAASILGSAGYSGIVLSGIALFVLSYLLILIPLVAHHRQAASAAAADPLPASSPSSSFSTSSSSSS
jgi:predicted MFS family arabinose efflux permease